MSGMRLFSYDHCPYCVRVRLILGLKDLAFENVALLNDDEKTPIGLVGAKVVPILQKENGCHMGESMEIVRYLDTSFGSTLLMERKNGEVFSAWYKDTRDMMRRLLYPRWVRAPLPEFGTEAARAYFMRKKKAIIGNFNHALASTPSLKSEMEEALASLDQLIQSPRGASGILSYEDIDLFGRLRGLTLVKDLRMPTRVRTYIDSMAAAGKVPLYDDIAVL